jgi:hypothetical protein
MCKGEVDLLVAITSFLYYNFLTVSLGVLRLYLLRLQVRSAVLYEITIHKVSDLAVWQSVAGNDFSCGNRIKMTAVQVIDLHVLTA